jgi:UDP-4-amino-4,6-dideoxy-N-acetyl-beta-L-altrosamine transaminase
MHIIPYGKQEITQQDIDSVVAVLKSDFLTQGPKVLEFEEAFASYVGAKYAIAVSNGTAALHLSTLALGLKQNENVITTPISFVATANCIKYCGGNVWFSDIDSETILLDLQKLELLLESEPYGTFKGVIVVNFAGNVIHLEKLRELTTKYGLWIIEDACHSPGGYFVDKSGEISLSGSSKFTDLSVFSFHPVKHIASGEGGMITTDNYDLYSKILRLRTHGITKSNIEFINYSKSVGSDTDSDFPGWYMEMQDLGFNYRLTDIQAALGLSQLSEANTRLAKRKTIAAFYNDFFQDKEYILWQSGNVEGHAYHLYILQVKDRLGLYNYLRKRNIFAQIHYFPIHLNPYYSSEINANFSLKNAELYYENCISIPNYPSLSDVELDYITSEIDKFYTC